MAWSSTVISIHAPREGCDGYGVVSIYNPKDISIHAPREGCDRQFSAGIVILSEISIHAPREGCDAPASAHPKRQTISIHAPREGCDSKLYQRAESLLGSICLFAQGEEG